MFSKPFLAWVGVGLLGVVTIPVVAAPRLAKLARRPAAERRETPKPVAKVTKPKPAPTTKPAAKAPTPKPVLAKKATPPATAKKPAKSVAKAQTKKPSATATARKLLH